MNSYAILLGGDLVATPRLKQQLAGSRFIAADGGIEHAAPLCADVDLWVGDFDSSSTALVERHAQVDRQTHPPAKDMTDGELAIEAALKRGAKRLILVGGLGGASDHAVAHLAQLVALAERNIPCFATSGIEEAWPLLPGTMTIDAPAHTRMSIIGFSALKAITFKEAEWPLEKRDVPMGSSLTMSNRLTGPTEIVLEAGYGVVMLSFNSLLSASDPA